MTTFRTTIGMSIEATDGKYIIGGYKGDVKSSDFLMLSSPG